MLAIIPAGGKAERFHGIYKDLLPLGDGRTLLSETLRRAEAMGCTRAVVVTSAEKAAAHERALSGTDATLLVSTGKGLWAAIESTFIIRSDALLLLPDTVFTPIDTIPAAPLSFGVFPTAEPERFSVVRGGTIVTKQPGPPSLAWGCVAWSVAVADWWQGQAFSHYDDAFRGAMREFGHRTFRIAGYEDFGAWPQYRAFVGEIVS